MDILRLAAPSMEPAVAADWARYLGADYLLCGEDARRVLARQVGLPDPGSPNMLLTCQGRELFSGRGLPASVRFIVFLLNPLEIPPDETGPALFTPGLFPGGGSGCARSLHVSVPSLTAYQEQIAMGFCDCLLARHPVEERDQFAFRTTVQEAAANAVIHGNLELEGHFSPEFSSFDIFLKELEKGLADPRRSHRRIEIAAGLLEGRFRAMVRDEGPGYTPGLAAQDDREAAHGRGLALISSLSEGFVLSDSGRRIDIHYGFPFAPSPFSPPAFEDIPTAIGMPKNGMAIANSSTGSVLHSATLQDADEIESNIVDIGKNNLQSRGRDEPMDMPSEKTGTELLAPEENVPDGPDHGFLKGFFVEEDQSEEETVLEPGWLESCRVLIVDDAELSREMIAAVLESRGFTDMAFAVDGEDALEKVDSFQPDIVILDLVMPKMDGLEVCRRLRSQKKYRRLPVLVQTGLEDVKSRIDVFRAGATDLVIKPVNSEELIARMQVHLENRFLIGQLQEYRNRMEADLVLAHAMQHELLPRQEVIDRLRLDMNLHIDSLFMPSSALGGDCWGILELPGESGVAVYLVDFSGHGVAPAVNTFRLHALLSDLTNIDRDMLSSPADVLGYLNGRLKSLLPRGQFAAMLYMIIEPGEDRVRYAASAFPSPVLCLPGTEGHSPGEALSIDGSGVPMGLIDDAEFQERTVAFPEGAGLMIYSDGLCDLHVGPEKRMEEEGARKLAEAAMPLSASFLSETLQPFLKSLDRQPLDDLTVLLLQRPVSGRADDCGEPGAA